MDFPSDLLTNAFQIDNIKEIYWAIYSNADQNAAEAQSLPTDEAAENDESDKALFIKSTLHQRGDYVFQTKAGLWVFNLSRAEREQVSQSLSREQLHCSSSGVLRSEELLEPSSLGAPIAPSKRADQSITGKDAAASAKSTAADVHDRQAFTDIYNLFVSAFLNRLTSSLAISYGWLPVGCRICIDTTHQADRLFDCEGFNPQTASAIATTFDAQWLSSGALIVSALILPSTGLCRLSETSGLAGLPLGTPILLSPSGRTAQYAGADHDDEKVPRSQSKTAVKTATLANLKRQGFRISQDVEWVRLELLDLIPSISQKTNRTGSLVDSTTTFWPATLCLCMKTAFSRESNTHEDLSEYTENETVDPLSKVERWLAEKATRMKAIDMQKRQEELAAAARAQDHPDTDSEESPSDFSSPAFQYITPQDVSGIYPTPPDGARSQDIDVHTDPEESDIAEKNVNAEDLRTPNAETDVPYEGGQSEDLFGDMDIDMFASKGLTDADFSFFDEPSIKGGDEDEQNHVLLQSLSMEEKGTTSDENLPIQPNYLDGSLKQSPEHKSQLVTELSQGLGLENLGATPCSKKSTEVVADKGYLATTNASDPTAPVKAEIIELENGGNLTKNAVNPNTINSSRSEFDWNMLGTDLTGHQKSTFDSVSFRDALDSIDDKYYVEGRFGFEHNDQPTFTNSRKSSTEALRVLPRIESRRVTDPSRPDTADTDEELSLASSNIQSRSEDRVDEVSIPRPSRKRKRDQVDLFDHPVTPVSPDERAQSPEKIPECGIPSQDYFVSGQYLQNRDLVTFCDRCRSLPASLTGNDQRFIETAQILVDQVVFGTELPVSFPQRDTETWEVVLVDQCSYVKDLMTGKSLNVEMKRCTFKDYVDLGKGDNSTSTETLPRQQKIPHISRATAGGQSIFKLQAPFTSIKRTGTPTDLSISALPFWEELSLRPFHGSKDISAFCIFPDKGTVADGVKEFLDMVGDTYQSCNLGKHKLGSDFFKASRGLVPVPVAKGAMVDSRQALEDICKRLGAKLAQQNLEGGNIVVYMVDPLGKRHSAARLCAAFLELFASYKSALKDRKVRDPSDVVLQIVPSKLVFSSEVIIMPSLQTYKRLAFEVYDRCSPNEISLQDSGSQCQSTPAIRLSRVIPKTIDFRLSSDSTVTCLQSDNCIHLAYAWDPGDQWLTASWTDNQGILHWNACYCFGEDEEMPWSTFTMIVKEIWETTYEMLQPHQGPWRLFIVKESPILKIELDIWQSLFLNPSHPFASTIFLTLDRNPPLALTMPRTVTGLHDLIASELPSTPAATPQANINNAPSPDISALTATPGGTGTAQAPSPSAPMTTTTSGDNDPQTRLVDVADETWGVTLDRSINDFNVPSHFCPALVSGFLLKRAGPRDEDSLLPLGVNIVHAPKPLKSVLREVLGMYRDLATLARVRGIVDPVTGVVPWHVAAVGKAHKVINREMRYEDDE